MKPQIDPFTLQITQVILQFIVKSFVKFICQFIAVLHQVFQSPLPVCGILGKTSQSGKDKEVSDIKERLRKTGPRRKVDYVILCCPPKDGKEPTSWPVKCKDPERGFIQNKECVFARYSHPVSQTANDWIRIKQRLTILNIKEKNSIQEKAEIRFRLDGPVLDVITYQG